MKKDSDYTQEVYDNENNEYTEDGYYTEEGECAEESYDTEDGECTETGYYDENGEYVEAGYYDENGEYVETGYYDENGEYVETGYYDENGEYVETGYYDENGEYAETGYYDENGEYVKTGYYDENGEYVETGYYDENGEYVEDGYYAEEGEYAGEGYYTEDGEYVETGYYAEDGEYIEGGHYTEEEPEESYVPFSGAYRQKQSKQVNKKSINIMDIAMVITGVAVLVLAIVTGALLMGARQTDKQISAFADVGSELMNITTIGGQGIQAVADATVARLEGTFIEDDKQDGDGNYGENNYDRQVTVVPSFTSIQKDLKIKFLNEKTDKLVANVPFSVVVTGPDGKKYIWSDDDMDGIIYKKDIGAGKYAIVMEELTDSRYGEYAVTSTEKVAEVRDKITYAKVDVSDEVIEESEIDASKEDTKKNEIEVESTIQDTVQWVESKVIPSTYNEVAKSTIPDPTTLVYARSLFLTSQENQGGIVEPPVAVTTDAPTPEPVTEPTATPTAEPTATPTAEPTATPTAVPTATPTAAPTATPTAAPTATPTVAPTATPTAAPTATPTAAPTATPTAAPTATPTAAPTATPTAAPTVTPAPAKVNVTVAAESLKGNVGTTLNTQATASGFAAGSKVVYSISGNNAQVASAIIDNTGKITISALAAGNVTFTVTANYENGQAVTQGAATFNVVVLPKKTIALNATKLTVFLGEVKAVDATVSNALAQDIQVNAETSDARVARAHVDKTRITIEPFAEGTAVLMVRYTENGETIEATCEITVKQHPRTDTASLLKDVNGQQLYVLDNNVYRQATHADYYTADKFFVCGEAKYTGWQMLEGKMYFFDANGNKVTGQQTIQGATYNFAEDGSLVTGSGSVGIDVSKWNGNIDWDAVANSGISYVIIRCGYRGSSNGKLVVDPKYISNIKGASAAGLKIGIYFFSQAIDEVEAVEEASMVLDLIEDYKITYPVFLDVETSGGRGDKIDKTTRTAVCKAFCETIQSEGYMAGVYSNKQWLEKKLDAGALEEYKIWLAQYAASPTYTGVYDMWQYTAKGSVNGISGDVDLNISYLGY